jgi:hypothetical protein
MLALVITESVVIALLAVLVAGLLRSHADILRALHSLGAGVGDPAAPAADPTGPRPVSIGPPLPPERRSSSVHDVSGLTPAGDALAVTVGRGRTLLAFLSSGCTTCGTFWSAFADPATAGRLPGVRLVVVTKGPELESPPEIRRRSARVPVIMSSEAWNDYEVPGSPFFVLVDGGVGRRIGEGVANGFDQVVDLVHRAEGDVPRAPARTGPGDINLDGPARESANDAELRRAGIRPGDPSLYPQSLADVFADPPPGPRPAGPG